MPLISIIIPAYNCAKFISETIASVQQQTWEDWELIVVNDGSTDNTLEVLEQISEPRLQIFTYPNGGVAKARNRGIAKATGEYIAFLDADDLWLSDKLELQLKVLQQNPQAGVAYSWTCFMDEQPDGYVYHSCSPYQFTGNVYPQLLESDFIHSGSNVLVRREAIETVDGFDSSCDGCADWDMWLRLAAKWHFVAVPKHQIMYRRTVGSLSSNVEKMYAEAVVAINKAYQTAPPQLQNIKSKTLANLHIYTASLYLQQDIETQKTQQAAKHLRLAIATNWLSLKNPTLQKLIIKVCLQTILPPKLSKNMFEWMRKGVAIKDPRQPQTN